MNRIIYMIGYSISENIIQLGIFLLILAGIGIYRKYKKEQIFLYGILGIYFILLLDIVGIPTLGYVKFDLSYNLIPFLGISEDILGAILNILLFIPLGVVVPLLSQSFLKPKNTIILGLCISLFIEILQIFTFRSSDITDIITNTLGCFIGRYFTYLISKKLPKNFSKHSYIEVIVCLIIAFILSFCRF